jgi:hypothetical protein
MPDQRSQSALARHMHAGLLVLPDQRAFRLAAELSSFRRDRVRPDRLGHGVRGGEVLRP